VLRSWRTRRQLRKVAAAEAERLEPILVAQIAEMDEALARVRQTAWPRNTPPCPKCGEPMIQRKAKRGPRPGSGFWGCRRYPGCTGLIPIDEHPRSAA
jgi:hypothetical protein